MCRCDDGLDVGETGNLEEMCCAWLWNKYGRTPNYPDAGYPDRLCPSAKFVENCAKSNLP